MSKIFKSEEKVKRKNWEKDRKRGSEREESGRQKERGESNTTFTKRKQHNDESSI